MTQIDKGIPIPPVHWSRGRRKYAFRDMEVGDSFVVAESDVHKVRNAATVYRHRHGAAFTVQRDGEAYRCWRVS